MSILGNILGLFIVYTLFFPRRAGREFRQCYMKFLEGWNND
jgi:hypothetical protein